MDKLENEKLIKSIAAVYGLLPQVAGAVIGITSMAYFMGWQESSSYFSTLGARWAIDLLSPTQLMQQAIWIVCTFFMSIYISIITLSEKPTSVRTISFYASISLGLAALIFVIIPIFSDKLGHAITYLSTLTSGFLWALAAGFVIGEVIGTLSETNIRWHGHHIYLIFIASFVGLWMAPHSIGSARANMDLHADSTNLPIVKMITPSNSNVWRLVRVFPDKALLISLADKKDDVKFKIEPLSKIAFIKNR